MSTTARSGQYCAGCVTTVRAAGRCTQCHWDDAELPEMHAHLPRHYMLMGRYYIGRVLGQGGFGVTYLARDMRLGRPVAVKEYLPAEQCSRLTDRVTIRSHGGEKADQFQHGLQGFLKEAHALAQFEGHANIVSITDSAEANGTAYLVMAYIEGFSLKQYLAEQGGQLPWRTAVETMMPVMDALRETHSQGLLHRDISPGNIMITRRGQVKVIDFGAARYAIGEHSRSLSMVLKPGYAPEEQYRTRGKQGPWTDVYAAAATLYQCITGQVPPSAPDRLAEDELAWPSAFCKDLPENVEAVVLKGMAVRAADRYQSIEEFQQTLLQAHGSEPVKRVAVVEPPAEESTQVKRLVEPLPLPRRQGKADAKFFTFIAAMAAAGELLKHFAQLYSILARGFTYWSPLDYPLNVLVFAEAAALALFFFGLYKNAAGRSPAKSPRASAFVALGAILLFYPLQLLYLSHYEGWAGAVSRDGADPEFYTDIVLFVLLAAVAMRWRSASIKIYALPAAAALILLKIYQTTWMPNHKRYLHSIFPMGWGAYSIVDFSTTLAFSLCLFAIWKYGPAFYGLATTDKRYPSMKQNPISNQI